MRRKARETPLESATQTAPSEAHTHDSLFASATHRRPFMSLSLFLLQETVPTSIKEAGGTMPVHTLTSTEYGTEAVITEASTKMAFSGLNTEVVLTP